MSEPLFMPTLPNDFCPLASALIDCLNLFPKLPYEVRASVTGQQLELRMLYVAVHSEILSCDPSLRLFCLNRLAYLSRRLRKEPSLLLSHRST